jgi:hypothetical protein
MREAGNFCSAALPQIRNYPSSFEGRKMLLKISCSIVENLTWTVWYFFK